MPGAQRTRSLACSAKNTRVSHYRHAGTIRHSLRDGVTVSFVLSSVSRAFLPPSPARITPRDLTPASGRQNHTTSPYATTSLVFPTLPRPSHPALHVRDDAYAPPDERETAKS